MSRDRKLPPRLLKPGPAPRPGVEAELLFLKLMLAADEEGRVQATEVLAAARNMPRQPEEMLPAWLGELEDAGCLDCRLQNGVGQLRFLGWHKYRAPNPGGPDPVSPGHR